MGWNCPFLRWYPPHWKSWIYHWHIIKIGSCSQLFKIIHSAERTQIYDYNLGKWVDTRRLGRNIRCQLFCQCSICSICSLTIGSQWHFNVTFVYAWSIDIHACKWKWKCGAPTRLSRKLLHWMVEQWRRTCGVLINFAFILGTYRYLKTFSSALRSSTQTCGWFLLF